MCPYRHENITDEDLDTLKKGVNIDEKIRERFHGINDPVAKKIIDRVKEAHLPKAPEDLNITTLFIGGIDESLTEEELKTQLSPYGKIKAIKMVSKQSCAFVCYHAREAAEKAVEAVFDRFFIKDSKLKVLWAKSQLEPPS